MNSLKYKFRKYADNYPYLFKKEKSMIKKLLKKANIEHIGSSSVNGLGGKGIIDIAIAVPKKEMLKTIKKLKKFKYDYKKFAGNKERKFLQKIIKYKGKERRIHIQLTSHGSGTWKSMTTIRDYLRKHKDMAKKYAMLKKEAVKYAKGDGEKYRNYKKSFLDKIEKMALKEK